MSCLILVTQVKPHNIVVITDHSDDQILRQVHSGVVDHEQCSEMWDTPLQEDMICFGDGILGPCAVSNEGINFRNKVERIVVSQKSKFKYDKNSVISKTIEMLHFLCLLEGVEFLEKMLKIDILVLVADKYCWINIIGWYVGHP